MIWLIGVPGRRRRLLRRREAQPVRGVAQPRALVGLAAEHLDHAVGADCLLQRVRQRAGALWTSPLTRFTRLLIFLIA